MEIFESPREKPHEYDNQIKLDLSSKIYKRYKIESQKQMGGGMDGTTKNCEKLHAWTPSKVIKDQSTCEE